MSSFQAGLTMGFRVSSAGDLTGGDVADDGAAGDAGGGGGLLFGLVPVGLLSDNSGGYVEKWDIRCEVVAANAGM